jgi:actin-related protein
MFYSGDNIGAVVADVGSYACRVGFAGEDSPRAFFPSVCILYLLLYLL